MLCAASRGQHLVPLIPLLHDALRNPWGCVLSGSFEVPVGRLPGRHAEEKPRIPT